MSQTKPKSTEYPIPKDLFEILACPLCKADLEYAKGRKGLVCSKCSAKYPIEDGIPVMMAK
ncbi:Trm112 family protein [Candidatus Woesearchaeota archaeon]|nr:Trm112 family protein [Candidatus Woesearchaeota archaeon]